MKKVTIVMTMMLVLVAGMFAKEKVKKDRYTIDILLIADKSVEITDEGLEAFKAAITDHFTANYPSVLNDLSQEMGALGYGTFKDCWLQITYKLDANKNTTYHFIACGSTILGFDFNILYDGNVGRCVYGTEDFVELMDYMVNNNYFINDNQNGYEITELHFN